MASANLFATAVGAHISDLYLPSSQVWAQRVSNQVVAGASTATAVVWDAPLALPKGVELDAIDASQLVFSEGGLYEVHYFGYLSSAAGSAFNKIWLAVDGNTIANSGMREALAAGEDIHLNGFAIVKIAAGQSLQMFFQGAGADTTLTFVAAGGGAPANPAAAILVKQLSYA